MVNLSFKAYIANQKVLGRMKEIKKRNERDRERLDKGRKKWVLVSGEGEEGDPVFGDCPVEVLNRYSEMDEKNFLLTRFRRKKPGRVVVPQRSFVEVSKFILYKKNLAGSSHK